MSTRSEPSGAVRDFAEKVNLSRLGCYELFAARGGLRDDGRREVVGPGQVGDLELDPQHEVGIHWDHDGHRFLVRLKTSLVGEAGEIRAGYQAEYELDDVSHGDVSAEVVAEYVNRVALMTLAPYLRQAIADLTLRTFEVSVTMGTLRPGDLNVEASFLRLPAQED